MAKEIQFLLYNLPDNSGKVQAYVEDETLWLTQKAMAELFGVNRTVVTKHLKIYLRPENLTRIQYVQNLHILQQIAKDTTLLSIILMPLSASAIA